MTNIQQAGLIVLGYPLLVVLLVIWTRHAIIYFGCQTKTITTRCNGQVTVTEVSEKKPSLWPPVVLSALFVMLAVILYTGW